MNAKRNSLVPILVLEAVFLLLLFWAGGVRPDWFSSALAFPFEQIGGGLRVLSLAGGVGNLLSILLYIAICLLPVAALVFLRRRRALCKEDAMLVLLTLLLFVTLYYMVNPSLVPAPHSLGEPETSKALFGGAVYSLVFAYGVFRVLRHFLGADRGKLQGYLVILLKILAVVFVYCAFGACFHDFLLEIDVLQQGNRGNEAALLTSYGFLFLRWLVNALPYVLDVAVILVALDLLEKIEEDRYSEAVEGASRKLSRLCVGSLAVTVLATVGLNLLQLFFLESLYTLHFTVLLPVFSIAFVLAALLLAQLMGENRQLKEDNDLFI